MASNDRGVWLYILCIRPVISRGKGQCLSEAEEVPRANLEAPPRLHKSTGDILGLTSCRAGIQLTYTMPISGMLTDYTRLTRIGVIWLHRVISWLYIVEIVYDESQKRVGGREGQKWRQEWSSSSERQCNEVSLAFFVPKLSESKMAAGVEQQLGKAV